MSDRRDIDMTQRLTNLSLIVVLILNVVSCSWWASNISTSLEIQGKWIDYHNVETKDYPIAVDRLRMMEDNLVLMHEHIDQNEKELNKHKLDDTDKWIEVEKWKAGHKD